MDQDQNPSQDETKVIRDDNQIIEKKAGEAEGERKQAVLHEKLAARFAAKRGETAPAADQEPSEEAKAEVVEQPPEEAPKVEEKKLTKLELAARKERKAHEERQRIARERQEIERERAELAEARRLAEAKAKKDYKTLLEGLDETELYTDLTKKYIGGELQAPQQPAQDPEMAERLAMLEQQQAQDKYAYAVSRIGAEIAKHEDTYPYILTTGSEHVVYDVILEHYTKNGRTMTWEQAAEITERYLENEYESKSKVRDTVQARRAKPAPEPEKPAPKPSQSKTISVNVARKAPVADTSFKPRTPDEARRAIMEKIRNRAQNT